MANIIYPQELIKITYDNDSINAIVQKEIKGEMVQGILQVKFKKLMQYYDAYCIPTDSRQSKIYNIKLSIIENTFIYFKHKRFKVEHDIARAITIRFLDIMELSGL